MEKKLSILTLVLFQVVTVVTPVAIIPVGFMNLYAPKAILSGNFVWTTLALLAAQVVFVSGLFKKMKGRRLLLKFIGFLGMIGLVIWFCITGDRGGDIGSKNSSGILFTLATAIPFIVSGVLIFIVALETTENNQVEQAAGGNATR